MVQKVFLNIISSVLYTPIAFLHSLCSGRMNFSGSFVTIWDAISSLHFMLCNMSPCTIELDDQTTMHFWVTNNRQLHRPNLVLIHGYGGHSRIQLLHQVRPLSKSFNLYIPDLLFFGKSYTYGTDRSDVFQAKCVREGLKRLGIEKYNLVGISYGGFVTYRMAENYGEEVEKVVIMSCGLSYTEKQKAENLKKFEGKVFDLLLPQKPEHAREMIKIAMHKTNPAKWVPDFVLWDFINFFIFYLSSTLTLPRILIADLFHVNLASILFFILDKLFSIYYRLCGLASITVDLDDQTTVHFWTTTYRRSDKPNLVMIHGYGGDARWQFLYQVGSLSRKFNLFLPDLLFFGHSYSNRSDRTDVFQAKCLAEGLKRLGVERFSVYSISYGGYVAYRMAEMCPKEMEKIVIVSSGVGWSDDQEKVDQIRRVGRDPREILLPANTQDLRFLVKLTTYKCKPLKFLPDFFLQEFINAMANKHRKEKMELVEHILVKKSDADLPVLSQETLIIWGEQDNIFPVYLAHQLQRHLGPKARVEIIKDTGHAANIESPAAVNSFITSFVLGCDS